MPTPLVLASASPRRHALLATRGIVFEVVSSFIPEVPHTHETPRAFAGRVAREKVADVSRRRPGAAVLGADTIVVAGGVIFGKPKDRADARRMLCALSGCSHRVLTAVALRDPVSGSVDEIIVESEVEFRALGAREIEEYLDTPEPYDKAGAYAVQGEARKFVVQVRGSYSNVVGLPMDEVGMLLQRHGPLQTGAPA